MQRELHAQTGSPITEVIDVVLFVRHIIISAEKVNTRWTIWPERNKQAYFGAGGKFEIRS